MFERDQEGSRIAKLDLVSLADDANATNAPVIGMDKGIDDCFPDRLMHHGLVLAEHVGFELERYLQIIGQPGVGTVVELEEISGPGPIRVDPVRPSHLRVLGQLLLVIDMELRDRQRVPDGLVPPEHQQARDRQAILRCLPVATPSTKLLQ